MSVNAYLNEKVLELPGINNKPGQRITYKDYWLSREKGRLYAGLQLDDVIPNEFVEFVEEITCHEYIPRMAERELGIYRHESAECELVTEMAGGKSVYRAKGTTKKLEDFRVMVQRIKLGNIRPNPEDSYNGPQGGKSRADYEREVQYLMDTIDTLRGHLADARHTTERLSQYHDELSRVNRERFWRLCSHPKVITRLYQILHGIQ